MLLKETFEKAVAASRELNLLSSDKINEVLLEVADEAERQSEAIIEANKKDLERMDPADPMYDRLLLDKSRVSGIVGDMRNVAGLDSPVGEVIWQTVRPNGMEIKKVRVPFGVIGVIYEARPNVSFDVFALCFKSANAVVLKGGSDAHHSNEAIVGIIRKALEKQGVNPDVVTLLPSHREATAELLGAVGYVDVLIPRGSSSLINYVRDNARVPVIETGAGICHTYFDLYGDVNKGSEIIFNAKTRRVSVCNALDTLIIHSRRMKDLPALCEKLVNKEVVIFADDQSYRMLEGIYPQHLLRQADESSYGTEFLDYKMSVKTVDDFDEAVSHITRYSSKHSEAIITESELVSDMFSKIIDAACVYINVSTAFTDGAQFGFGAEIGISTQKLHARGPMALAELTSYKYVIIGDGQVRW